MKKKPVKANKQFVEVYCEERSSLRGSPYTPPLKLNGKKPRVMWAKINRSRLPKTGIIIAGSYRGGVWTMSSPCLNGFPYWSDGDRTHYFRLPVPPALTAAGIPCKQRRAKQ